MNLIIDTMIIYSMKYVLDTSKEERLSLLSLVLFPLHLYACKQQPSHNTQTHTHTHFLLSVGLAERRNLLSELHEVSSVFGFMEHL